MSELVVATRGGAVPLSTYKKAPTPALGPAYGNWSGRDATWNSFPGSAILQFDLESLTLEDYRAMRWHPQINASLCMLTFMIHQLDWHVECDDKKIEDLVGENLFDIWTRLVRALSQAFWAGYSPNVLEFENDVNGRRIIITKVKDLVPEDCEVNWKYVEGYAPPNKPKPKLPIYDGIKQWGAAYPIPPENTLWYPLLMENGNYWGRKLLKPAFAPWYFSTLIHLFANRYYERAGEPIPVGRAPFDDVMPTGDGSTKNGKEVMEEILMSLRSRAVVTLPSDRDPITKDFDYTLEYLEAQMRGTDFEKYLSRLDEEISLGIFTPILMFRTGDVGSHNLGVQHTQTFLWMLNALAGDIKEYIDRYICDRLKALNVSPNAPACKWVPRKLGKENQETVRAIMTQLIGNDKATVDLEELGEFLGMTVKEVRTVTADAVDDEGNPVGDGREVRDKPKEKRKGVGEPRATGREISARIRSQVHKAWRDGTFGKSFKPEPGFRRRMEQSFTAEGHPADKAHSLTNELYGRVGRWLEDAIGIGMNEYHGPDDFMALFDRLLDNEIDALAR